jgi:hypothetical protein
MRSARLRLAHHLDHAAVGHALVGAQLHLGVGVVQLGLLQRHRQLGRVDRLVVEEGLARLVDRDGDELRRSPGLAPSAWAGPAELASSGAVMMKITTSTSITSTRA